MKEKKQNSISYLTLEETLELDGQSKQLTIGIPKESTFQENRVPLTPGNVSTLVHQGHKIVIESEAGSGAHFSDLDYSEAGAMLVQEKQEVYESHIIVKAAPISDEEVDLLKPEQIVISPLHISTLKKEMLDKLLKKRIIGVAFELIKDEVGSYPIVRSMSEIAGNMVMIIAAELLSNGAQGRGVLLGGVTGIPPANVVIIGAGIVGEFSARSALGLGANVKIFDNSTYRLMRLQNNLSSRIFTSALDQQDLVRALRSTDVLITALQPVNGQVPMVVNDEMVQQMKDGAVIIDVNIDRGGAVSSSEVTTHENPIFQKYGVTHYCVPNIASRVPHTGSVAISHVLMPLITKLGDRGGFESYIWNAPNTLESIYLYKGYLTNNFLSKKYNLRNTDINIFRPFRES